MLNMTRCYSTICMVLALSSAVFAKSPVEEGSYSQLHTVYIDTLNENILVIHKRYASVFFKQSDIQEYIANKDKFGLPSAEKFILTNAILHAKKKRFDFNDWFAEYSDNEKQALFIFDYGAFDHIVMPEVWYIGYDLIKAGKFMIIEKETRQINCQGLKLVTHIGESGSNIVQFQLPSGFFFWHELSIIGE
jgi:hypothetical protein